MVVAESKFRREDVRIKRSWPNLNPKIEVF